MTWPKCFRVHPDTLTMYEVPRSFHNKAILTGYRPLDRPWSYYLQSLFHLHNETFNIWTHIVGIAIFAALTTHLTNADTKEPGLMAPLVIQGICSIINHFLSALTHWLRSKSTLVNECIYYVDYMGIAMLSLGNHVMLFSFSYDRRYVDFFGRFAFAFALFLSCFATTVMCHARAHVKPHTPHTVKYYNIICNLISLSCGIGPLLLRFWYSEVGNALEPSSSLHFTWCSLLILTGIFFGSHMPETFFPGKFDIFGHSHMIFHILVTSGQCVQQLAAFYDMKSRYISAERRLALSTYGTPWTYFFLTCLLNGAILAYFLHVVIKRETKSNSKKKY